ncbi:MAG: hypothetical protein RLZ98_3279 [Pseudomonadota bacterium]|jgi:ABC-type Fe3+-hydroxamate transport system substrate-binding protein
MKKLSILLPAAALLLSGCGSSSPTLPSLTTGSIFAPAAKKDAGPPPITAVDRAIHLGAMSARAAKCGYNFDSAKLRQDYLSYETTATGAPDAVTKATEAYDKSNLLVAKAIAKDEAYCSATQTKQIKADLVKALAGDYTPPIQKQRQAVSWLDSGDVGRETINWEGVFDPTSNQDKTKRVLDE